MVQHEVSPEVPIVWVEQAQSPGLTPQNISPAPSVTRKFWLTRKEMLVFLRHTTSYHFTLHGSMDSTVQNKFNKTALRALLVQGRN